MVASRLPAVRIARRGRLVGTPTWGLWPRSGLHARLSMRQFLGVLGCYPVSLHVKPHAAGCVDRGVTGRRGRLDLSQSFRATPAVAGPGQPLARVNSLGAGSRHRLA